jgi:excisionase family DNA binding protein
VEGQRMTDEFEYLNTQEVAEIIRMSNDYVSRQCALGNLRAKKLGTEWRIRRSEVERFMAAGVTPPTRVRRRAS